MNIYNILEFYCWLSTNDSLMNQSPDYLREKFDRWLGLPSFKEAPVLSESWSKIYEDRWQPFDKLHNNFFHLQHLMYQPSETTTAFHWFRWRPADLVEMVVEVFGPVEQMTKVRYSNLHELLKRKAYDVYHQKHVRYFKLQRILNPAS